MTDLIKKIQKKIDLDSHFKIIWDKIDTKKDTNYSYINKYMKYSENYLSTIENTFTINHINSLEKKICDQNSFNYSPLKISIKISEKLKEQRNIEKPELNTFIKEEIDYYTSNRKIRLAFPCDTILKYKKQAMKFEGISPPNSDLIIMYYFSKLFMVDYKILKKCSKNIQKIVEEFNNEYY